MWFEVEEGAIVSLASRIKVVGWQLLIAVRAKCAVAGDTIAKVSEKLITLGCVAAARSKQVG